MMNPPTIQMERPIKMRGISLAELKSCPKLILSPSHWMPVHHVEECGANEQKEKRIESVPIKKSHKPKNPMFRDIEKECVQCHAGFIWTAGEQKFMNRLYEEGKVQSIVEPKRCADCRKKKKERFERQDSSQS